MALVGYARVSSLDQQLAIQLEKLQPCDKIYTDQQTGTTAQRPGLQACLDYVRDGDTLLITRLDRLARSTLDLCQIAATLQTKGVALCVVDQHLDTSTITGRLTFHVLAAIAEFETALRAERQREGIAKAKQAGVYFGRRKVLTPAQQEEVRTLRAQGMTIPALKQRYHLGKTALYRYLDGTRVGG